MRQPRIKADMATAIKVAKAVNSLRKQPYISFQLFRKRLEEQDVVAAARKVYSMWNYMIENHTITKVSQREFHWNGSITLWDDIDKANAYCLNMLRHPSYQLKAKKVEPFEAKVEVKLPVLATIDSKLLVEELRSRGWQITASRQVTITEEL